MLEYLTNDDASREAEPIKRRKWNPKTIREQPPPEQTEENNQNENEGEQRKHRRTDHRPNLKKKKNFTGSTGVIE